LSGCEEGKSSELFVCHWFSTLSGFSSADEMDSLSDFCLFPLQGLQTQDRYVFLFNDLMIFGKGK